MIEPTGIFLKSAEIKLLDESTQPTEIGVSLTITNVKVDEKNQEATLYFEYQIDYKPDVARVVIKGYATGVDSSENLIKLKEDWKEKNEKTQENLTLKVLDAINTSVGLNAVLLLRPFNLLPPFTPPPISGGSNQ